MNRPIRAATIVQTIPRLDAGGAERATVEIADAVTRAGGRCFIFTEGGRLAGEAEEAGGIIVPFRAATKNPARLIANASVLARFVRARGVELIHARSRAPAWSALIAARRTGAAYVTTYHGAYGNRGPFKSLYNSIMARGDLVIANSRYTASLVHSRHGTPETRIRVIPRGVDLAAFDPKAIGNDRIKACRAAWGVDPGEKIVLHAARLTGWKGQRHVIDAAAELVRRDAAGGVAVVLAGDVQGRGSYKAELERRIARHGLQGMVHIVGHCPDMPAAFATAHVAVVASTEPEAFGRTSVEAQAMGCPVIVTEQGASPETILFAGRDGASNATGWLVPVADSAALADALSEALALTRPFRGAMGRRARAHVAARYSSREMKRATLAVYDELLRSALQRAFDDAAVRSGDR
jgi:glycosyltransferase involved in cell wall biosynthesis